VALGSSAPTTAALPILVKPALASSSSLSSFHAASNGADDSSSAYQHHQLIGSGGRLCRHLREVATMQTAALYLAPAAFLSPFEEEQHQLISDDDDEAVSVGRAQSYMAFLTDPTRLIANPGLRHSVRGRVGKKPGFKKKPAQWVFLFFFGFLGFFGPEERVLGFFQFQEYF
jgi:hypothetical protein